MQAQSYFVQRVMDILNLNEQTARTLLSHHHWDIDKLLAVFVEKGKDQLFAEAGVVVCKQESMASFVSSSALLTCSICMDDSPGTHFTSMNCGHCFCNSCWTEHFIVNISDGQSKRIRCMAYKCNTLCDEAMIRNLVKERDSNLAERFERFLFESYIEDNKSVKWCPSIPHCGNAVCLEDNGYYEVECLCGLQFCFKCLSEVHSPCSCLMWQNWTKRYQSEQIIGHEQKTRNWLIVNSKPCPDCFKPIQKNGGCNLMVCICGLTFCWRCCKRLSCKPHVCCGNKVEKKAEKTKKDVSRFTDFAQSYEAHIGSYVQKSKFKEKIDNKISNLESKPFRMKDFSWVMNGLQRLLRSRQVLACSYAFAYFMFGNEKDTDLKKNLFEHQQQQLETIVEKLSETLKEPFDTYTEDRLVEMRTQIINLSAITYKLSKELISVLDYEREPNEPGIQDNKKSSLRILWGMVLVFLILGWVWFQEFGFWGITGIQKI